jgi:hypothetical protein
MGDWFIGLPDEKQTQIEMGDCCMINLQETSVPPSKKYPQ